MLICILCTCIILCINKNYSRHSPLASLSLLCAQVSLCSEVRIPTGKGAGSVAVCTVASSCCMTCEAGARDSSPLGASYRTSNLKNCVRKDGKINNFAGVIHSEF